jgi:uncharacterized iron-regulated membrane protein
MLKHLSERLYPQVWRWHFLVGLFCAPVLLVLSLTGMLYAFQPQLEPLIESDWQRMSACEACTEQPVSAQLEVVQARFPNAQVEHYLEFVDPERSHVVLLHAEGEEEHRLVWINPYSLEILGSRMEDEGFFPVVFALHTRLLSGEPGRWVIELVASWIVVTLLMGLALWWPRRAKRGGGWLPRFRSRGRRLWRDLHAVSGFYLLPLALIVVYTGLLFSPVAGRALLFEMAALGQIPESFLNPPAVESPVSAIDIDALVADFKKDAREADWFASWPEEASEPLVIGVREALPWNTRMVYYDPYLRQRLDAFQWSELRLGSKALLLFFPLHTGQILGWPGQVLAMLTALGLAGLVASGVWMWSLRRSPGSLSLPPIRKSDRWGKPVTVVLILLALLMPLFGLSLLTVLLVGTLAKYLRSRKAVEAPAAALPENLLRTGGDKT